jgi:hypothetical protein
LRGVFGKIEDFKIAKNSSRLVQCSYGLRGVFGKIEDFKIAKNSSRLVLAILAQAVTAFGKGTVRKVFPV